MELTPAFLPGESHGQRSLEGYSPWGHKESDTAERLSRAQHSKLSWGFPGGVSGKGSACQSMQETQETQVRSLGRVDPCRRKQQSTPEFLPGESYGQRSGPQGHQESDTTEVT